MQGTQSEYWHCRSLHRACPSPQAAASFTSLKIYGVTGLGFSALLNMDAVLTCDGLCVLRQL